MTGTELVLHCLFVSVFWGATNPLIKKSTKDINKIEARNPLERFLNEINYLVRNWTYVVLFIINQLGSVLYFVLLQSLDLSLIVPVVNAFTFIITSFVGLIIGESAPSFRTILGIVFVLVGITLCVFDKISTTPVAGE